MDLLARRVRYDDLVPCTTAFIDTRTPGSDLKENFTIIGPGVSESPDQHVHIDVPHGFNIGGARQPPHCVNSQHSHETAEVFVVHSGTWAFRTGEHGEDGEAILKPGDVISIPTHVFRGFENIGEDTGFLFAILGGDDPGRVLWAPHVLQAARQHGLVLLESGSLIDTAKGEQVPNGAKPMPVPTREQLAQLRVLDDAALAGCVLRRDAFLAAPASLLAAGGIAETPIVGVQQPGGEDPVGPGKLEWPHGFQLRHLRIAPGIASACYRRHQEEVLFVHEGQLAVETLDAVVELGAGDLFTSPIDATRRIRNTGNAPAEVYSVLGSDAPTAERVRDASESQPSQETRDDPPG